MQVCMFQATVNILSLSAFISRSYVTCFSSDSRTISAPSRKSKTSLLRINSMLKLRAKAAEIIEGAQPPPSPHHHPFAGPLSNFASSFVLSTDQNLNLTYVTKCSVISGFRVGGLSLDEK
ncbi:hypothetical protein EVAR_63685_1 [Eumeta japonica]|uniref:Uncharacterized protein n=1 Tax=Eumeta variegata TaxID=151549 RepID=A0A4C1ZCB6_EUMVA|nr:hypothetical protein EVAR_63685_1 [Eumeta japonica]